MQKMKVRIYEEKSKTTGNSSLILTTSGHGFRTKKALGLKFKTNPQTEEERRVKKEKLIMAAKIANDEEKKLLNCEYMIPEQNRHTEDFITYANKFVALHPVSAKGKQKYKLAIEKLKKFYGKERICAYEITEVQLKRFAKFLEVNHKGETANNIFRKLKQILTAATSDLYFKVNPANGIKVKKSSFLQKAVLSKEELIALYNTPCGNKNVARAFLFSATCTGLRFGDVKSLCWRNIQNDHVRVIQNKTNAAVTIPLNHDAINLLGERGNPDEKVFILPSHNACLKWLRKWTADAGIKSHITFHCSRHTFGTILIANNVNLSVASKLMGHHSTSVTERYVRVNEQLKANAVKQLPSITF